MDTDRNRQRERLGTSHHPKQNVHVILNCRHHCISCSTLSGVEMERSGEVSCGGEGDDWDI